MNSKVDERFETQVIDVCQVYHDAPQWAKQLVRVVSTDEMTGVQALERKAPDLTMTPGQAVRREVEYIRHGTLCFIVSRDVATGQVIVRRRSTFPVQEFFRFLYHVEQHYPQASIIYIALDNWPVHFHDYVLNNLARIQSKIRLLRLPTYAPWTNPIEKFWLKLNREFMNQHPYGRDEAAFRDALDLWLDKHREESEALLHEVGLLPDAWKGVPD